MENHPSREKLELFLRDRLTGDEAVEVLLHLDECEECCGRLPKENPQDVIESLLTEDNETETSQKFREK